MLCLFLWIIFLIGMDLAILIICAGEIANHHVSSHTVKGVSAMECAIPANRSCQANKEEQRAYNLTA